MSRFLINTGMKVKGKVKTMYQLYCLLPRLNDTEQKIISIHYHKVDKTYVLNLCKLTTIGDEHESI